MAQFSVDVDDTDLGEVKATLDLEVQQSTTRLQKVIADYALLITRDAKRNAPVDTGRLRASIIPELEGLEATIVGGGSIAGANVDYAAVQEFGNIEGGIEGKRYMTRAYKKRKDDFRKAVRKAADLG